jgi:iron complex outermembrane recepter protein
MRIMGKKFLLSAIYVAIVGISLPCQAQTADAAAPAAGKTKSAGLEEIVVTAEKRESNIQSTPVAITALSGDVLQTRHVADITDLGSVAPSVQMVPVAQTVLINIRGVGSDFFDPRGQSAVSSTIDGLSYARPAQAGAAFFDVNRIEVLMGPQGTLYGTNAAGGAVNLITNQPSTKGFDMAGELTAGNYSLKEWAAMLNLPASDTLAFRFAGKGLKHNGYIVDTYDDADSNAFRASAKWTPTDAFTAYLSYNYAKNDGHGTTPVSYPCDSVPYSNVTTPACGPPGPQLAGSPYPLDGTASNDLQTVQLNLTGKMGFATLTSITGYLTQHVYETNSPNGSFFTADVGQGSHDFSEELRFNSNGTADHAGGLAWVAGGYYSKGDGYNSLVSALGPPTVLTALPEQTSAGFAQLTYGISDRTRATAGVRYTHDKKGVSDIYGSDLEVSKGHLNYRAEIETDLAKHSLAYLSISTAYVSGGVDAGSTTNPVIPVGTPGIIPPIFEPETITAYEIGSKNTFLNGSLRVNGAIYYYQVKKQQGYFPGIPNNGALALEIQNIGDEDTRGAEITVAYAPTAADLINFATTLSNAKFGAINYGSFGFGPTGLIPVVVSQPAGFPVHNVPDWDARFGYSHTWDAAALNGSISAGFDFHASGSYWVVPGSTYALDKQKSYTMTDLHLSYEGTKGFYLTAWAKNLENNAVTTYSEGPHFNLWYLLPPRTYGLTIGYKYGGRH